MTLFDLRMLRTANKQRRTQIESSAFYVGYRLQWIIRLFLKGKKFPTGEMDLAQYKHQVLSIVDFVTDEDNLAAMLDFDPREFFETMVRLFLGHPWLFITNSGKYQFEFDKRSQSETEQKLRDEARSSARDAA